MPKSALLRLADVRAIYDLAQECRDLGDSATLWRRHWFERLGGLVGADLVVGGDSLLKPYARLQGLTRVEWGWENGFNRPCILDVTPEHSPDLNISPLIDTYIRRPSRADGMGFARTDLVPDRYWYESPYYRMIHKGIGVEHTMVSFLALPGGTGRCSALTLSRGDDSRGDFTARDRELLREAHAAVVPLVGGPLAGFDEPSPTELTPRVRQVLRCLLEGDSDKQAAARVGISPHTVNQYVKSIFKHFGVTTRAELLARWLRRGWGAQCIWSDEL